MERPLVNLWEPDSCRTLFLNFNKAEKGKGNLLATKRKCLHVKLIVSTKRFQSHSVPQRNIQLVWLLSLLKFDF